MFQQYTRRTANPRPRRTPVIHKDRFTIIRHPDDGAHPTWRVYEGEEEESLVCVCAYKRGAIALVNKLLEMEATIGALRSACNGVA